VTFCKVTPAILHGVVSPEGWGFGILVSGSGIRPNPDPLSLLLLYTSPTWADI